MTTMVEDTRAITGGVDTHTDLHVAAALDSIGGLLGVQEFPATAAGYAELLSWLRSFGNLALAGVEGTGSYGAGLARYLAAAGVRVVEVDRADRQDRHRQGKSDPLDAVSAARAAQSGRASGAPRGRSAAIASISCAGERRANRARSSSGPVTISARAWLTAWVRSWRALRLATISARIASTAPSRPFGAPHARPDCAARAALTASSGSDLPCRCRSCRSARSTSTTPIPAAARCRVRAAP